MIMAMTYVKEFPNKNDKAKTNIKRGTINRDNCRIKRGTMFII